MSGVPTYFPTRKLCVTKCPYRIKKNYSSPNTNLERGS